MSECGCTAHGGFLTRAGLALVAQRERELLLTPEVDSVIVDRSVSVSGLELERDLHVGEQLILFPEGSPHGS